MKIQSNLCKKLFLAVALLGSVIVAHAATVTLKNNCGGTVYPGVYPASIYSNGGWSMAPGATVSFNISGSGRLWGRTGCNGSSPAQCTTGQCGGTGLQCAGTTGVPNTSLFEFTINASGTDWYNVSYVDAIDNPIGVTVSNSSCISPNTCPSTVITNCPAGLKSGNVCLSPCTRYNTDQFCCRGAYGTAATCVTSAWTTEAKTYLNNVHSYCPHTYAYAYDESSGALQTCGTGVSYNVTFCPSGSSSGGGSSSSSSSSSGGTISGQHTLIPRNATNKRVDDAAGSTAGGTKIQIWTANGTGAQNWVFSSAGVVPAGNLNIALAGGPNCMDVGGWGTTNGTKVILWPCTGGANQSWKAVPTSGGYYSLQPAHAPGMCLDVPGSSTTDGTQLQIYACNGTNAQQFLPQ